MNSAKKKQLPHLRNAIKAAPRPTTIANDVRQESAVSMPSIIGKWKYVETRADLTQAKRINMGRKGGIIEFMADGRKLESGCSPSRSFGPVMYRLTTHKKLLYLDTFYANGTELRKGICKFEADRLIICSTTSISGPAKRPLKFGGFTETEKDPLRHVDIYERLTKKPPVDHPQNTAGVKLPLVRLCKPDKLLAYLRKGATTPQGGREKGIPSPWIKLAELEVRSGSLWAGDPLCLNEEDGALIKVASGLYVLEAQGMDIDGYRVVARLRVYPHSISPDLLKTGPVIGATGTDSASITICDLRAIIPALDGREVPFQGALEKQLRGHAGIITVKLGQSVDLLIVQSGFGDGTGPVHCLRAGARRVGMELVIVQS